MKFYHLILAALIFLSACQRNPATNTATDTTIKADTSAKNPVAKEASADTVQVDTFRNIPASKLIVPGERIGETKLGETGTELFAAKDKPDAGDAAMGKAWSTWYSKPAPGDIDTTRNELNVFTLVKMGADDGEHRVKLIRVTSPFFATKTKVSAKKQKNYIQKVFPDLKKLAVYPSPKGDVFIYDDSKNGIAFEFLGDKNSSVCKAVMVHDKGEKLPGQIAGIHNDLKNF